MSGFIRTDCTQRVYFLVYDCRDFHDNYLGRVLLSSACYKFEDDSREFHRFVREALDSNEVLSHACFWRIKWLDTGCLLDLIEDASFNGQV